MYEKTLSHMQYLQKCPQKVEIHFDHPNVRNARNCFFLMAGYGATFPHLSPLLMDRYSDGRISEIYV